MAIAGAAYGASKSLEDIVAERILAQKLQAEIADRQQRFQLDQERLGESKRASMVDEGQRQQTIDLTDRSRRDRNNQQGLEVMQQDKQAMDTDAIMAGLDPKLQKIAKLKKVGVSLQPEDLDSPEERANALKADEE